MGNSVVTICNASNLVLNVGLYVIIPYYTKDQLWPGECTSFTVGKVWFTLGAKYSGQITPDSQDDCEMYFVGSVQLSTPVCVSDVGWYMGSDRKIYICGGPKNVYIHKNGDRIDQRIEDKHPYNLRAAKNYDHHDCPPRRDNIKMNLLDSQKLEYKQDEILAPGKMLQYPDGSLEYQFFDLVFKIIDESKVGNSSRMRNAFRILAQNSDDGRIEWSKIPGLLTDNQTGYSYAIHRVGQLLAKAGQKGNSVSELKNLNKMAKVIHGARRLEVDNRIDLKDTKDVIDSHNHALEHWHNFITVIDEIVFLMTIIPK